MSFLGLYVANARLEATNLPAALTVVANKMKQVCSETIVLIVSLLLSPVMHRLTTEMEMSLAG
jgi:hypothetical protein